MTPNEATEEWCRWKRPVNEQAKDDSMKKVSHDVTAPPPGAVEGFVFKPAGSDVVQVWQKINGQHVRIDDADARPEEKVTQ